jgi:hypothetical protein
MIKVSTTAGARVDEDRAHVGREAAAREAAPARKTDRRGIRSRFMV